MTNATGFISTIVGTGTAGWSGDSAAATAAKINKPKGVALDASGNIYIADTTNDLIRWFVPGNSYIYLLVGDGTAGSIGDGAAATSAEVNLPAGIAVSR